MSFSSRRLSLFLTTRRCLLLGLGAGWFATAASAQISVDFRPATPGSDELVLEWVADPSLTGPFDLLSVFVPPRERVVDALPLDPSADLYLADVATGTILSRALESDDRPGVRVYQVVDASGGCSNLAYLVTHEARWSAGSTVSPSLPWRGGLRSTGELLEDIPQARSVIVLTRQVPAGRPSWRETRRLADGSIGPESYWVPPGAGVIIQLEGPALVVIAGAAEPAGQPLAAGAPFSFGRAPSSLLSLPVAATRTRALDLLCGEEGADWTDTGLRDCPDACSGGLHGDALDWTAIRQLKPPDSISGRNIFTTDDDVYCVGDLTPNVDPTRAVWEAAELDGRSPRLWRPADAGVNSACRCLDSDGDGEDDCTELLRGRDPNDRSSFGSDHDRDGVGDWGDNCPVIPNPGQEDLDGDAFGDACDSCPTGDPACEDGDGDGVSYLTDNCPDVANPNQRDGDGDWFGDACDNCPSIPEIDQVDSDGDGLGNACDACPDVANADQADRDGDGFADACDPCPDIFNPTLYDGDGDGRPVSCDCVPSDPGTWGLPRSVELLTLRRGSGDGVELAWSDHRADIGSATTWDLARGSLSALWAMGLGSSADCHRLDHATPASTETDAGSWWFVVRETNACGRGPWRAFDELSELDFDEPCR